MAKTRFILLKNGEAEQGFNTFADAEKYVCKKESVKRVKWEQEEQGIFFWRSASHNVWEIEVSVGD